MKKDLDRYLWSWITTLARVTAITHSLYSLSEAAGLLQHCCHGRITWNLRPIVELNPLVELVHRKILACIRVWSMHCEKTR